MRGAIVRPDDDDDDDDDDDEMFDSRLRSAICQITNYRLSDSQQ